MMFMLYSVGEKSASDRDVVVRYVLSLPTYLHCPDKPRIRRTSTYYLPTHGV